VKKKKIPDAIGALAVWIPKPKTKKVSLEPGASGLPYYCTSTCVRSFCGVLCLPLFMDLMAGHCFLWFIAGNDCRTVSRFFFHKTKGVLFYSENSFSGFIATNKKTNKKTNKY